MVIQESGNLRDAVAHLEQYQEQILDKLSILETLGIVFFPVIVLKNHFKFPMPTV